MRSYPVPVGALVLVTVTACSLPERDNAFDSALRPKASFRVLDGGLEVTEAPRGHAITLDGSTSTDPQQEPDELTYRWEFRTAAADWSPIPEIGDSVSEPLPVAFKNAHVSTGAMPVILELRVTATDDTGAISLPSTTRTLKLTNAAPVAQLGPRRTFPAGGFPWSPGADFTVRVDGSGSSDPDGDALDFQWELSGNATMQPGDGFLDLTIPPDSGRVVVSLRVSDGIYDSSLETEILSIREPSLWSLAPLDYPASLDPTWSFVNVPTAGEKRMALLDLSGPEPGDGIWVAILVQDDLDQNSLYVGRWPDFSIRTGSANFPDGGAMAIATDPDRSAVWTALGDLPGKILEIQEWTFDMSPGLSLTEAGPAAAIEGFNVAEALPGLLAVDGSGTAWAGWTLSTALFPIAPATGTVGTPVTEPGKGFSSVVRRPGPEGEVWALATPNFIVGESGPSAIVRLHPQPQLSIALDVFASAIAWADDREIWLTCPNQGMFRLDADILAAQGFDASVVATFPEAPDAFVALGDPETGELWSMNFFDGSVSLTAPDGLSFRFEREANLQFIDPVGALWYAENDDAGKSLSLDPSRRLSQSSVFAAQSVAAELDGGGAWVTTFFPLAIAHIAEDGSLLAFHDSYSVDGQPDVLILDGLHLDHRGGAWAFGQANATASRDLLRVDLTSDPPAVVTVLDDAANAGLSLSLLGSSTPADTGTFAWALDAAESTLLRVAEDGSTVAEGGAVFADPETSFHSATSLATGEICVASIDAMRNEIVVRVAGAGQGIYELARGPISGSIVALAITRGSGGGPDRCWLLTATGFVGDGCGESSFVQAWPMEDTSPAPYADFELPDFRGHSFVPRDNLIWVSGSMCTNGTDSVFATHQVEAQPPLTTTPPIHETILSDSELHLASPETSVTGAF